MGDMPLWLNMSSDVRVIGTMVCITVYILHTWFCTPCVMDRFGVPKWVHLMCSFGARRVKSGVPGHPGVDLLEMSILVPDLFYVSRFFVSASLDRPKYYT